MSKRIFTPLFCIIIMSVNKGYGNVNHEKGEKQGIRTSELPCPSLNINTMARCDPEILKSIGSVEECSQKCREKPNCNFWTWAKKDAGKWPLDCVLMSDYGFTISDNNVISGKRTCFPEVSTTTPTPTPTPTPTDKTTATTTPTTTLTSTPTTNYTTTTTTNGTTTANGTTITTPTPTATVTTGTTTATATTTITTATETSPRWGDCECKDPNEGTHDNHCNQKLDKKVCNVDPDSGCEDKYCTDFENCYSVFACDGKEPKESCFECECMDPDQCSDEVNDLGPWGECNQCRHAYPFAICRVDINSTCPDKYCTQRDICYAVTACGCGGKPPPLPLEGDCECRDPTPGTDHNHCNHPQGSKICNVIPDSSCVDKYCRNFENCYSVFACECNECECMDQSQCSDDPWGQCNKCQNNTSPFKICRVDVNSKCADKYCSDKNLCYAATACDCGEEEMSLI